MDFWLLSHPPIRRLGRRCKGVVHHKRRQQYDKKVGAVTVYEAQRFDLRFLRPFRADLSIRKSSSFFPPLIAATSQRGFAPRPAQVSPEGLRYLGGTFFPLNGLRAPRTTFAPPILSNCFSSSARRS